MDKKKAKRKRSHKRKAKKYLKKYLPSIIVVIIWAVASYWVNFIHFETVDISDCEPHSVVITDLEYHSNSGSRGRRSWATFKTSGVDTYYVFDSENETPEEEFKKLQQLAEEKTKVTITYSDYRDYKDLTRLIGTEDLERVVDIRTEDNIIFNVDEFNHNMKTLRIVWLLIITFFLILCIGYFIIMYLCM